VIVCLHVNSLLTCECNDLRKLQQAITDARQLHLVQYRIWEILYTQPHVSNE